MLPCDLFTCASIFLRSPVGCCGGFCRRFPLRQGRPPSSAGVRRGCPPHPAAIPFFQFPSAGRRGAGTAAAARPRRPPAPPGAAQRGAAQRRSRRAWRRWCSTTGRSPSPRRRWGGRGLPPPGVPAGPGRGGAVGCRPPLPGAGPGGGRRGGGPAAAALGAGGRGPGAGGLGPGAGRRGPGAGPAPQSGECFSWGNRGDAPAGALGNSRKSPEVRRARCKPAAERAQRALVHALEFLWRSTRPDPWGKHHLRGNADYRLPRSNVCRW